MVSNFEAAARLSDRYQLTAADGNVRFLTAEWPDRAREDGCIRLRTVHSLHSTPAR
jgi:hypothetical protein